MIVRVAKPLWVGVLALISLLCPVEVGLVSAAADPSSVAWHKIRAVDADNHTILLNRPGVVSVIIGTNEDSQEVARAAGKAMYPFQGRPDFQLIVVVDLRDSMATWAPSIATSRMRSSLDEEAVELKPYFLKNGNKSNPRLSSHVVPDMNGSVCPLLGWPGADEDLRFVIFGTDGKEFKRSDKVSDMNALHNLVRQALQAGIDAEKARDAAAAKMLGTKSSARGPELPPLPPELPVGASN